MSNRSINYCDPKRVIRSLGYARSGVHKSTLVNNSATARFVFMGAPGSVAQFKWSNFIDCDLKSYLYYTRGLTALWPYYKNNQLLQVCNATPTNVISQYDYGYDVAGRRISCAKSGSAFTQDDTLAYGYNSRSELTNAAAAVDSAYRYSYAFDDIGNRESSLERGTNSVYTANQLNQYTMVGRVVPNAPQDAFVPQFDDDGNQTLVKTATGIWSVTYNGENRPVLWTLVDSSTPNSSTPPFISMSYDRMGRRVTKNAQRFVYDGYLQIADNNGNAYVWDPTEKVATRPLVWNSSTFQPFNFSTAYYTHDGNKNVSEVADTNCMIAAHYEYAPFGGVIVRRGESCAANPWRFSSEFAEDDTATVYYNYRHYEPVLGRWLRRDPMWESEKRKSIVAFCCNSIKLFDYRGLNSDCCCKVCLYSAVDLTTVRKRGPVDVGEGMRGHTWIMIESCSATEGEFGVSSADNTFSFGPIPTNNSNKDLFWGVPGGYWDVEQYEDLTEFAVAKKCWSQTADQCEKIKKDITNSYPDEFSLWDYCTSAAVDFLEKHGIDAPDGVGEIDMPWWFPNVDRSNPKDMYDQIISGGGKDIS